MNPQAMERTKKRTLKTMEEFAKFPPEEIRSKKHDAEVVAALKEAGFSISTSDMTRCRKLLAAGFQPKEYNGTELAKMCSGLPHRMDTKEGQKRLLAVMRKGTKRVHPLTQKQKVRNLLSGHADRNKKRRHALREQHPDISVGPLPIPSHYKELAQKTMEEGLRCGILVSTLDASGAQPMVTIRQSRVDTFPLVLSNTTPVARA